MNRTPPFPLFPFLLTPSLLPILAFSALIGGRERARRPIRHRCVDGRTGAPRFAVLPHMQRDAMRNPIKGNQRGLRRQGKVPPPHRLEIRQISLDFVNETVGESL